MPSAMVPPFTMQRSYDIYLNLPYIAGNGLLENSLSTLWDFLAGVTARALK